MNIYKIGLFVLVFMMVSVSGIAAADAAWKKIGESNGIVGYTRPTPKSSIDEIKAVGIVDAPVAVVEAVLRDFPAQKEYMYLCKQSYVITDSPDLKNTTDLLYSYNLTDMPMPVKDRDAVARVVFTIDKATDILYIHGEGIKNSYNLNKGNIRMPLVTLDYTLVPKGPDKTEMTYLALADPGGNLPSFIVNMLTKNLGIKTVSGVRDMVKKDKYKNVKAVITTTPHK